MEKRQKKRRISNIQHSISNDEGIKEKQKEDSS
jgi:hypothetical protein